MSLHVGSVIGITDVGTIWNAAVVQYEAITNTKISTLARPKNIDEILREITLRETAFSHNRHDGSRLDKFRTTVKNNLVPIEMLGDIVSKATKSVRNLPRPEKHETWTAYVYETIDIPPGRSYLCGYPVPH